MSREQLLRYKGNRCSHCGMGVAEMLGTFGTIHRIFHLHHVFPGSKDPNYDNLIRQQISSEQLD